jgi:hypothetical protein
MGVSRLLKHRKHPATPPAGSAEPLRVLVLLLPRAPPLAPLCCAAAAASAVCVCCRAPASATATGASALLQLAMLTMPLPPPLAVCATAPALPPVRHKPLFPLSSWSPSHPALLCLLHPPFPPGPPYLCCWVVDVNLTQDCMAIVCQHNACVCVWVGVCADRQRNTQSVCWNTG